MKAIVYAAYGSPDVLQQVDIPVPVPAPGEVLVQVRAAGLNPLDWHLVRGMPLPLRLAFGLRRPRRPQRLGIDYAGVIASLGQQVTGFRVGEPVFGGAPLSHKGSLAEYIALPADSVVAKPEQLTFAQAAGVFVGGVTALKAMRDKAQVKPGQKVLIVGASGGVGTFAVQIAKSLGASVTGVQSTRNLEMVTRLGADHVIDYTREDFTARPERYDVILDNVCDRRLTELRRIMTPHAIFMRNSGGTVEGGFPVKALVEELTMLPFISQKSKALIGKPTRAEVEALAAMASAGRLTTVVDRTFPLRDCATALRHVETGHAAGKVIIDMAQSTGA